MNLDGVLEEIGNLILSVENKICVPVKSLFQSPNLSPDCLSTTLLQTGQVVRVTALEIHEIVGSLGRAPTADNAETFDFLDKFG
jgi:hypothetical protein